MDQQISNIIHAIHDSPVQAVLVASGGGSQALAWLMSVPGATRTVLEVTLPYSHSSFERFLGMRPAHFVARETAIQMAAVAYRRARILAPEGTPAIGLACTAALVTDRPRRGEDRCHVAVRDERRITTYALVLQKGSRDRAEEEDVVSRLVIRALADACGCAQALMLPLLPSEYVEIGYEDAPDPVLKVLRGEVPAILIELNGQVSTELPRDVAVLPGAFNPLHGGHTQLAHVAGQMTGRRVIFELSVLNVDKPPLLEADVRQRLEQFYGHGAIALTTTPLFEQKARLFPGSVFVVGYDTATRLVSPRYYGGDTGAMLAALESIRARGCRFLVAGRLFEGRLHTLDDVPVPEEFVGMFTAIPAEVFRVDISSTALREQASSGL